MGIGLSFFTEVSAPAPASTWTSSASAWPTGASCGSTPRARRRSGSACRPRARGTRPRSPRSWPRSSASRRGHRGVHGDTDNTPFGLGTYGSRSTPVSGAAAAVVARGCGQGEDHRRGGARVLGPDDLEWEHGRWFVKGDPDQGKTIQEIAMLAHGASSCPRASRAGSTRRPCTTRRTSRTRSAPTSAWSTSTRHRAGEGAALHRRGRLRPRINPMIVEGQIHGGLATASAWRSWS
jgi:aerobic carbon-monoxide dehydrogenase large subunit